MIEPALVALLLASPAVTALVAARIRPQMADQAATFPHVTYTTVSDIDRGRSSNGSSKLREARISFDAWGRTLAEAHSVARALSAALDPRREPGQPWAPLMVHAKATIRNGREVSRFPLVEPDLQIPNSPAARAHRVVIDFLFDYHEQE